MIKTVLATVVAAAFLISVPTARAEDKAPAPEKAEKAKKEKKEKKEEPKKEEKAGGGW